MKVIVLDDDPTGTQCASNVRVLFSWDSSSIAEALKSSQSIYLQTNSRALSEDEAIALAKEIKEDCEKASKILNEQIQFVLRGDSTLRGHIFSESSVFTEQNSPILFLPAYPEVGRTTIDGEHYVRIEGENIRADKTEFSQDPVFGFKTSALIDFVSEKSNRTGINFSLDQVRKGPEALAKVFLNAPPLSVLLPDAETDSDIEIISEAVKKIWEKGESLTIRSAAPLAALLAGVRSNGLLTPPLNKNYPRGKDGTLLVAGSHTAGATKQLAEITARWGAPIVIDTEEAMLDPHRAAIKAVKSLKESIAKSGFGFVTSERNRKENHNTLLHGQRVMQAIIETVKGVSSEVGVVIAKGGITSAEVARSGIGAKEGLVLGQILPGISAWRIMDLSGREILYIVVPGNIGDPDTLMKVLEIIGMD